MLSSSQLGLIHFDVDTTLECHPKIRASSVFTSGLRPWGFYASSGLEDLHFLADGDVW